jgi:hypothetical protein
VSRASHAGKYAAPSQGQIEKYNHIEYMVGRMYEYQTGPRAAQQRRDVIKHGVMAHAPAMLRARAMRRFLGLGYELLCIPKMMEQ